MFLFYNDSCVYWIVARYCRVNFPVDFVVVTYFVVLSAIFSLLVLQRGCEYLLLGFDTVLILCLILFLFTVLWPLCGLLGYTICTVQFTLSNIAVWNWWLAICTMQVILYSTAECNLKFAQCNLHYTVLQYGTSDLQFAMRKLHYTVLQLRTDDLRIALCNYVICYWTMNWRLAICTIQVTLYRLQYRTGDLKFAQRKLHYTSMLYGTDDLCFAL